jgi:hypothetical protein
MEAIFKRAREAIIGISRMYDHKYPSRTQDRLIAEVNRLSPIAKDILMFLRGETMLEDSRNSNDPRQYQEYVILRRKFEQLFKFEDNLVHPGGYSLVSSLGKGIRGLTRGFSRCCGRGEKEPLYPSEMYTDGLGNYDILADKFTPYRDPHGWGYHGDR